MSANLLEGRTGKWEVVIGLEVHAQVTAKSKLFSGASTEFGAEPNTQVSLVDAAMPGMLPVINRVAVEQAVRTGLGLQAKINLRSVFDRKNYYYPDLPPGYQISQYKQPVVGKGALVLDLADGSAKSVGIERVHLEQDAGKSLHDQDPRRTFVDLNRAGVALMEIVSEPDLRSADEAGLYLAELRSILRYLGTCDGDMEKGNLRADVNVSVRRAGAAGYGTRCEIKNVNSIRFVKQAVEYEARRQIDVLEDGGKIDQETRLFDSAKGETRPMRSKEEAHDYRYFPDPDLLPLIIEATLRDEIGRSLPELPAAKRKRFLDWYGLPLSTINVVIRERMDAIEFERRLTETVIKRYPRMSVFLDTHTDGYDGIKYDRLDYERVPLESRDLVKAIASTFANVSANNAVAFATVASVSSKEVLERADIPGIVIAVSAGQIAFRSVPLIIKETFESGRSAEEVIKRENLSQISDFSAIEAAVDKVIASNPTQVAKFRVGDAKVVSWLVGQVMKITAGKANPQIVNQLLAKKLSQRS
jgi:aspartyl-tRNA(Asn)/glutamyl-tRNA(Gln) amidotransferase subunit B